MLLQNQFAQEHFALTQAIHNRASEFKFSAATLKSFIASYTSAMETLMRFGGNSTNDPMVEKLLNDRRSKVTRGFKEELFKLEEELEELAIEMTRDVKPRIAPLLTVTELDVFRSDASGYFK